MYSFTLIHESRNLKQARYINQYVDLLRSTLATPSWDDSKMLSVEEFTVKACFVIN